MKQMENVRLIGSQMMYMKEYERIKVCYEKAEYEYYLLLLKIALSSLVYSENNLNSKNTTFGFSLSPFEYKS